MKHVLLAAAAGSTLAWSTAPAVAQEHPNMIAVGVYHFDFDGESEDLQGPFTPPGVRAEPSDMQALAVVYTRRISPNWSANLAVGSPPEYELEGRATAAPLGSVGEARALSPALLVQYHFAGEGRRLTPFVGAGVSWNRFYDAKASATLEAALGGPTQVEIDDAFGVMATAGVDYDLTERWVLTASAAYNWIDVDATIQTGPVGRSLALKLDPIVYRVTIGYRF